MPAFSKFYYSVQYYGGEFHQREMAATRANRTVQNQQRAIQVQRRGNNGAGDTGSDGDYGSMDDLTHSTSSSGSPIPSSGANISATTMSSGCGSSLGADDSKTNLIINYVPPGITQDQLQEIFKEKGSIESMKLIRDKMTNQSLGYAFVNYRDEEGANQALRDLNGLRLLNKNIKVSLARKSSESIKGANLYVSGFPKRWGNTELVNLFSDFGEVITARILMDAATGISKGVGFVRFDQKRQAECAIDGLNGKTPNGLTEPIQVKYANNPSAAATAMQAAQAAAAAASNVGSGSGLGGGAARFSFPVAYPAMAAAPSNFVNMNAAALAFLQGGLGQTGGLGLGGLGPMMMTTQGPISPVQSLATVSSHRSRLSPVGPIHHQTSRTRYSPMSAGDMGMSSGSIFNMGQTMGMYSAGGQQGSGPTLYVAHLPEDTNELSLYQLFGQFNVQNVKVMLNPNGGCKGIAFVTVGSMPMAQMAISSFHGYHLPNGQTLHVALKSSNGGSRDRK